MTGVPVVIVMSICHDIYPARGRKPTEPPVRVVKVVRICHDIYPARGRKLIRLLFYGVAYN